MKDDRRDREGLVGGRNPNRIPVDEAIIRFEEEHDRIIVELGAYLGLFTGRWGGDHGAAGREDPDEIRDRVANWCAGQLRRGQNPPDAVRGLRMAVMSFSDEQILTFAEGLVEEARTRIGGEVVAARLV